MIALPRRAPHNQPVTQLKNCLCGLAVLLIAVLSLLPMPVASADPASGARITGVEPVTDRWVKVSVYSPSMDKVVVNDVLKASGNTSAPVFYLLNGIDGGLDNKGWFGLTDVQGFFANQNVNIVSPIGGQYSYYTDWVADDPALGRNKWQTYLTQELPPLINQELKANGRNAVGGLSMSGGAALDLAIQAPGLYRAAGSYSGCPATSDPNQANQIALSLIPSGANAVNMWGPLGGPDWVAHDPSKNAAKLRGVGVYAAASTGAVGAVDNLPPDFPTPVGGQIVEGITRDCTRQFADAAAAAGVPITFVIRPEGAHTWGLFESEMQESWNTVIAPALGVTAAA